MSMRPLLASVFVSVLLASLGCGGGDAEDINIPCNTTLGAECKTFNDKVCACSSKGQSATTICKAYSGGDQCSNFEPVEASCASVNKKSGYDYCQHAKG